MLIQEGKDEGACADLAAATISEVENAVNTQQQVTFYTSLDHTLQLPFLDQLLQLYR